MVHQASITEEAASLMLEICVSSCCNWLIVLPTSVLANAVVVTNILSKWYGTAWSASFLSWITVWRISPNSHSSVFYTWQWDCCRETKSTLSDLAKCKRRAGSVSRLSIAVLACAMSSRSTTFEQSLILSWVCFFFPRFFALDYKAMIKCLDLTVSYLILSKSGLVYLSKSRFWTRNLSITHFKLNLQRPYSLFISVGKVTTS